MFFCLGASFFIFPPQELARLSKTVLASIFAVQNFFLLSEAGYFDADSINKPLLHVWSLSIEEQFYLLWPFLYFLFLHKSNKKAIGFVFIAIVFSVSISLFFTYYGNYEKYIFYLLPFRFYEFLLGVLAFFLKDLFIFSNKFFKSPYMSVFYCCYYSFLYLATKKHRNTI